MQTVHLDRVIDVGQCALDFTMDPTDSVTRGVRGADASDTLCKSWHIDIFLFAPVVLDVCARDTRLTLVSN
jgi:hypothetical protein